MTEEIRLKQGVMAEEIRVVEHLGYKHGPGRAQLEFILEDSATFVAAAKQAKLKLCKRTALFIHGDDRPGAIADILAKLAGAHINVAALQAVCGEGGRYGAIVFLPPAAAGKAASVLAAA